MLLRSTGGGEIQAPALTRAAYCNPETNLVVLSGTMRGVSKLDSLLAIRYCLRSSSICRLRCLAGFVRGS